MRWNVFYYFVFSFLFSEACSYGIKVIDKKSTEKQIRFDFDTNKLKDILAKEGLNEDPIIVYDWTRKYFKDMGYEKVQRSVYKTSSTKPIKDVVEDVLKFSKEYEYLMPALKSFQITCIEDTFDVTHIINGKERNINKSKVVEKQANEQQIENDNGNFMK